MVGLPLHIVLRQAIQQLDEFPKQAPIIPKTRYSVPNLAISLLKQSPDPYSLGEELCNHLNHRSTGSARRQLISQFQMQVDDNTMQSIVINDRRIRDITDVIGSSSQVQLALYRWTDGYFHSFLLPMRQISSPTSPASSFRWTQRDTSFPRKLLSRDGPACLITGTIHLKAKEKDFKKCIQQYSQPDDGVHKDILEGSHIVPFSIADDIMTLHFLAKLSGYTIAESQVAGRAINELKNGFMMEKGAHSAFGGYRFGIECSDAPDGSTQYRVRFVDDDLPKSLDGCDGRVLNFGVWEREMRPGTNNSASMPDRRYLDAHLAIARVLHASGPGKVIDQILKEEEAMREECRLRAVTQEEEEGYFQDWMIDPDYGGHCNNKRRRMLDDVSDESSTPISC